MKYRSVASQFATYKKFTKTEYKLIVSCLKQSSIIKGNSSPGKMRNDKKSLRDIPGSAGTFRLRSIISIYTSD